MARTKKTDPPKKRRGSAPGVKPQARSKPAVQPSLPNVSDGRIAKLEELDAERTEAKRDAKASNDLAADVEQKMIAELEREAAKSGRDRYRTNSGFLIQIKVKKSLDRKRVPKPKVRKGQAVPTGVA